MSGVAALGVVSLVVASLVGLYGSWSLLRSGRYMVSLLLLASTIFLVIGTPGVLNDASESDGSYFIYLIAALSVFTTTYPAIPRYQMKERLRMYFFFGLVIVALVAINLVLAETGLPVLEVSLLFVAGVMLAYTIGTICTSHYKLKKRNKTLGISFAIWGAVAASHLLFYPALAILAAAPAYCDNIDLMALLSSIALVLVTLASLGVRSEGNYWERVEKKPSSVLNSFRYLPKALRYQPGSRIVR